MANIAEYTFNSSTDTLPTFNDGYTYTYTDVNNGNGTTTRTITSDTLPTSISFSGKTGLVSLSYLDTSNVTSMKSMFNNCVNLTSIDVSGFNTNNVTDISGLFSYCRNLTSLDLSSFNTSNITKMQSMFDGCKNLTSINLSSFNTSKVTDMSWMFSNCSNLISLDLSSFNTSKVTNVQSMFHTCSSLTSVDMDNSDISSINKIISLLPTRTADSPGTLKTGTTLASNCDMATANSKYWNVEDYRITEIVFNKNINANATVMLGFTHRVTYNAALTPQFIGNIGSVDNFVSIYNNNTTTFDISKFSNIDGVYTYEHTLFRLTIENNGNVYATILDVGGTYTFITRFKSFLHSDTDNGNGTVSRVVFCDPKPEIINYADNGIINVNYLLGDKFTSISSKSNSIVSLNLSGCDTSNVTNLDSAFRGDRLVSVNLSGWNVENVTTVHSMLRGLNNLESINISGWKFTKKLDYIQCFVLDSPKVREVIMKDSNVESINRVIGELKMVSGSSPGVLKTGRIEETSVNYTSANAKFWNVEDDAIVRYKFRTTANLLPTFNEGFVYDYTDVEEGTVDTIRTIWSDTVPTSISFEGESSLSVVTKLNTSGLTSMNKMFYNSGLKTIDLSRSDTSKVTDMSYLFANTALMNITGLDVIDTSKVNNMSHMFYYCQSLTSVDLSSFDTNNVTNMYRMFYRCAKLTSIDVSHLDTSNVTNMDQVFEECSTLTELDLSSWNTSKVSSYWGMFRDCPALRTLNISGWEVNGSRDQMFGSCKNLMTVIMKGCSTSDINDIMSSLPSRTYSSPGTITLGSITGKLPSNTKYWNIVSDVTYSKEIIKYTTNGNMSCEFNDGLTYAVRDVVNSDRTVTRTCTSDSSPTSINFENNDNMTSIKIDAIDDNSITDISYMFGYCSNLTSIDLSNFDTSNVTDMNNMFRYCTKLTSLDLSYLDTSNVTDMEYMFCNCTKLTSVDLSNFDTSNVINMTYMFYDCTSLTTLDISNFDTNKGTDIYNIFKGCNKLVSINMDNSDVNSINKIITKLLTRTTDNPGTLLISDFDPSIDKSSANAEYWRVFAPIAEYTFNSNTDTLPTFNDGLNYTYTDVDNGDGTITRTITGDSLPSSISFKDKTDLISVSKLKTDEVTSMNGLFYNCYSLSSVDLSGWNTSKVTSTSWMFQNSGITTLNVSNFNTDSLTAMGGMFYNCRSLTSIEGLSNFNTSKVQYMQQLFSNCSNLTSLDLNGWDLNAVTMTDEMLGYCNKLTTINMTNNDMVSINKVIARLPKRTTSNYGTLNIGTITGQLSSNINYWNIVSNTTLSKEIFKYTSNANISCVFNNNLVYAVNDVINADGTVTRTITSDNSPTSITFADNTSITSLRIDSSDTSNITSTQQMFHGCENLTSIDLSNFDTSNVTSMNMMFDSCYRLTSVDLSSFNTSKVTNTSWMFSDCQKLQTINLSNFNTDSLTAMGGMFYSCRSLTSIEGLSNFNTSKVQYMQQLFTNCSKLESLDLNGWDLNAVTMTDGMLRYCDSLLSINMKNSNVVSINKIITQLPTRTADSTGTLKIGMVDSRDANYTEAKSKYWNVQDDIIAKYTFNSSTDTLPTFNSGYTYDCIDVDNGNGTTTRTIASDIVPTNMSFNGKTGLVSVSKLNTSGLTDMTYMFFDCSNVVEINATGWDVSNVINMVSMCHFCTKLVTVQGLETWDTSKVENFNNIFIYCQKLENINVSTWDTSSATKMSGMFQNCLPLTSIDVSDWDVSNVTDMDGLFRNCQSLTSLDVSKWDTGNVYKMSYMFTGCRSITSLDVSNFNTDNVTDMNAMFRECELLTSIDVSNFNTSMVYTFNNMFYNCKALKSLDLSGWVTDSLLDMGSMFEGCSSLETIVGLNDWNTAKVTKMNQVFSGCKALTNIEITNWNTSSVTTMPFMFGDCSSLTSLDVSNFDTRKVGYFSSLFKNCKLLTSIDISNFKTDSLTYMGSMFEGCEGLTSIDISHFNISKVTNMSKMFKGCTNLTTLVLNGLDISKVSDMSDMLSGVCNIEDIRMKNTDVECVNKIISLLDTVNDKGILYINNQANELPTIDKDTATTKNCRICYREGLNIQHVDNSIKLIGKHIKSITSGPAYL